MNDMKYIKKIEKLKTQKNDHREFIIESIE